MFDIGDLINVAGSEAVAIFAGLGRPMITDWDKFLVSIKLPM